MQWFHRRSTKCGRGRRTNSARISHPPPFRRVTKNGTDCLPVWHAMHLGWSLTVQPNRPKGRVVCGTVYGELHLKDLLGSFVRVVYRIMVPDFYLVLHGLRCRKSTIMD